MLSNVSIQAQRGQRQVTLRHPNSMACTVYRKQVLRTSEEEVGGLPDMGGVGVLDSEDEAAYTYPELGDAKVLFMGVYQGDNNLIDSDDGVTYSEGVMECQIEPLTEGAFEIKKHDRFDVFPGNGMIIPYEVVGRTAPSAIPPYVTKYLVQPRQDELAGI